MEEEVQEPETITAEENEKHKFCPKIEPTNNNMGDLPYNEKLNIIEKEVQSLYEFCLERKFTKKEINNCLAGMYGPKKSLTKKTLDDSARHLSVLSVIVALIAVSMVQMEIWTFICASSKLLAVKTLPYWDWASLYHEECLVENYWRPDESINITSKYCEYCDNIEIERLSNVSHSLLADMVADNDFQPFVVIDTAKHMNVQKLSMDEIIHMYQHHPILSNTLGHCIFQNNAGLKKYYDFFDAYANKSLPSIWHASWDNCDARAAKVIRGYYSRPYFLPLSMQLESENIIITSLGMDANVSYNILKNHRNPQGILISVISGTLKVVLTPNEECIEKFGCSKVAIELFPGETLFYIIDLWSEYYLPIDSGITIAIATAVAWDENVI